MDLFQVAQDSWNHMRGIAFFAIKYNSYHIFLTETTTRIVQISGVQLTTVLGYSLHSCIIARVKTKFYIFLYFYCSFTLFTRRNNNIIICIQINLCLSRRFQISENNSICHWVFICSTPHLFDMLRAKFPCSALCPPYHSSTWNLWRNPLHNCHFLWTLHKWNCGWLFCSHHFSFWVGIFGCVPVNFSSYWCTHRHQCGCGWGKRMVEASGPDFNIINLWCSADSRRTGLFCWRLAFASSCLGESPPVWNHWKTVFLLMDHIWGVAIDVSHWFVSSVS